MESLKPIIEAKIAEIEAEIISLKEEARRIQKTASEKEKELIALKGLIEEKKESKNYEKMPKKQRIMKKASMIRHKLTTVLRLQEQAMTRKKDPKNTM